MTAITSPSPRFAAGRLGWPLIALSVGIAAVAIPTLIENARQSWALEQGQQAPLVLALGLWLLARRWPRMRAASSAPSRITAVVAGGLSCALYVLGRLADQYTLESYGLYLLLVTALYVLLGGRGLAEGWFPLAYLLFALPLPYTVVWALTAHLRLWVTEASVAIGQAAGLSIVRDGLNILVDQYELAVQEACSGMNSLFSLTAIGLLYLQLRRAPPWWYFAIMIVPIIAFAVAGNLVRILVLIALTHFFGDEVAQSFLHETAGMLTFATALLGVTGVDAVVAWKILPAVRPR